MALVFPVLATGAVLAQTIEEIDRIICIVNDDVIVTSEMDRRIEQVRKQLTDSGNQAPPYQILQKQVLDRLVLDRLQLQVARKNRDNRIRRATQLDHFRHGKTQRPDLASVP